MGRPMGFLRSMAARALGERRLRARIAAGLEQGGPGAARLPERLGQPGLRRPPGTVVWLHAARPAEEAAMLDLARRVLAEVPCGSVLVTTEETPLADLPDAPEIMHQLAPAGNALAVRAFLDHWKPTVCIWAGARLNPVLLDSLARRGIPAALVDAQDAPPGTGGWRRLLGLEQAALSCFDLVLATDPDAAVRLVAAGSPADATEAPGPLEAERATLPCNLRERDAIGAVLKARPVWLAVAVPRAEDDCVIAAHRYAARSAHRLLLILVPDEPERGPALAAHLGAQGFNVALRSVEGEPDNETEILVADGEGDAEFGLWYRLSPVTYMGGSFTAGAQRSRSPLEPAALGSAILHGPETAGHEGAYTRFARAGATRPIGRPDALGEALSDLLSPDRAAELAHSAWRVSTGSAEVSARIIRFIGAALGTEELA